MTRKGIGLIVIVFLKILTTGCGLSMNSQQKTDKGVDFERQLDSIASWKIDSSYKQIQRDCDSARKYKLPLLIDSLLKDTTRHEK